MSEEFKYCEECNTPLSQCGEQGIDGIPTMDCIACKLRNIIAEKDKEIEDLKKAFQMSEESRKGWLAEFDGYKNRLAEARRIIEQIGTPGAERIDIIRAAEAWMEGTP